MKSLLFTPLKIRDVSIRNRVFMSPMCQYSASEGVPNHWHLVHLGSRAIGGAGLVMVEATGVNALGRISSLDVGLWNQTQADAFKPITEFVKAHGATAAIQLAHAGRKASTLPPWQGGLYAQPSQGGWSTLHAPSAIAYDETQPTPHAMSQQEILQTVEDFVSSAQLALQAGFQVVELHMAHGYLLHQFLSPLSNQRQDEYGGSLENRMRFPLEVAKRVRQVWPHELPLFVRISATDWVEYGWDLEQSLTLVRALKQIGVDFLDCSTGGLVRHAKIPVGPGYQVPFAREIRKQTGILTGAVGLITEARQAEQILSVGDADAVLLARAVLRDPYWPLHAANTLNAEVQWPPQYERAIK